MIQIREPIMFEDIWGQILNWTWKY